MCLPRRRRPECVLVSRDAQSEREKAPRALLRVAANQGLLLANHVTQQIDAAVGVAPFVVVPADQLEEAVVQLDAAAGVEDARMLRRG